MREDIKEMFEAISSKDKEVATVAVNAAITLRDAELSKNGYTSLYYDYDAIIEDYNNFFDEDLY